MKKIIANVLFFLSITSCYALDLNNAAVKKIIVNNEWNEVEVQQKAFLGSLDVLPVRFNVKNNLVPSCALIYKKENAADFIDILITEENDIFPHCLSINEAAKFKMLGLDYFLYIYSRRDLRDTTYDEFFFLHQDKNQRLIADRHLNELNMPEDKPKNSTIKTPSNNVWHTAKIKDGIAIAKSTLLKSSISKEKPGYRFSSRDFISNNNNSFSIFTDHGKSTCLYVIENEGEIKQFENRHCLNILASGNFEKSDKIYFLSIFKDNNQAQKIDLFSIDQTKNTIIEESKLGAELVSNNKIRDIKTAKKYLAEALK